MYKISIEKLFIQTLFLRSKIVISFTSLLTWFIVSRIIYIHLISARTQDETFRILSPDSHSRYNMIHLARSSNLGESRQHNCTSFILQAWMIVFFAGTLFARFSFALHAMHSRRSIAIIKFVFTFDTSSAASGSGTSLTLEKVSRWKRTLTRFGTTRARSPLAREERRGEILVLSLYGVFFGGFWFLILEVKGE